MLALVYFDWFGTLDELNEIEEKFKAACDKNDDVEYKGRYGPLNRKYNWVRVFETDKWPMGLSLPDLPPRDYKKLPHWVVELLA